MDDIKLHRVDESNYDDVMSIRGGVYDGQDYLPALYRTMMTNHIGYAASCNGKLVAFECITFVDDGETMVTRALRVHKDHEGKGLIKRLGEFIDQDNAGNTKLKQTVFSFGNKKLLKQVDEGKAKLVFQKAIVFFQGSMAGIASTIDLQSDNKGPAIRSLVKQDIKDILSSEKEANELFSQERIIADWIPYRLRKSNVDHFFDKHCYILGNRTADGSSDKFGLITLGIAYTVPNGIRYNLEIYGDISQETLSGHIAGHLRNCSKFGEDKVNFIIHYESGKHDCSLIVKTMEHYGMPESDKFHSVQMYALEKPFAGL